MSDSQSSKYTREQIFDKITKLMAMANDPKANENVAAAATAKAQELMQKWAIEESELEAASGKVEPVKYVVEKVPQLIKKRWPWEGWLSKNVGDAFMVYTVYSERDRATSFCGREEDVKIAAFVYSQLRTALDRMARDAFQVHAEVYRQQTGQSVYKRSNAQAYRGKWLTSWMDGAVFEVGKKLKAQNQTFTQGSNTALVLVETRLSAAKEFAQTQFRGLYTPKSRLTILDEARKLGAAAGRDLQINKGLTDSSPNKLKG